MKDPWIRINNKYDVMKMTDVVHLVSYNSRTEEQIENGLKGCKPYQPPSPSTYCPSIPNSCLNCYDYLDYKLRKSICTFEFILKIDIQALPSSGHEYVCGKYVIIDFYKGEEHYFASEIIYSVKKDCSCDQLKVGIYILLSMKDPWIRINNKYDVMKMTDVVHLVSYNSRTEEQIENGLKGCKPYQPPSPSTYCPSIPNSCLNCYDYLDYKLRKSICTFEFILKIDIQALPSSGHEYVCGKYVIIDFYKGEEHYFASEIIYSVKKDCSCDQLKVGIYILLSMKDPWIRINNKYDVMKMTDVVHLVSYNSRTEEQIENGLKGCKPYQPPSPSTYCPSIPNSVSTAMIT
ncbi:uncharacterized protein LOC143222554 isoform X2 [Tachypleus tridentatus]|uniref:uncharacterized protein LOC143222554 isoform X2 n=1 Tax=Tachypleus tridentatus TaxID=6853 RepID=UPI003FCFC344